MRAQPFPAYVMTLWAGRCEGNVRREAHLVHLPRVELECQNASFITCTSANGQPV